MEEDPPAEVDGGGGSEMDRGNVVVYTVNVSELPDEVLEYIFKLISPYADFQSCYRQILLIYLVFLAFSEKGVYFFLKFCL